ncbi:MAG: RNA polymerase subunit sigma-70 [Nocardioidaceae bacterium]
MSDRPDEEQYLRRAEPYRPGVLAHCYRMLGSVRDADRVVQETYRQASTTYAGAPSPSDHLYEVATGACLSALVDDSRRPLPSGLGGPSDDPEGMLTESREVLWLEPLPDAMVDGASAGRIGLGVVAALQQLPPRHRAALLLSDDLGWTPPDIARLIGVPVADVHGMVVDAAGRLDRLTPGKDRVDAVGPARQDLLARYATAFEDYDVTAITALFTPDATWEMPPFTAWFRGPRNIGRLIATHCPAKAPGDQVMVPIEANGQPGFAVYMRDAVTDDYRAFQIQVLALTTAGVAQAVAFFDLSLFEVFELPELLSTLQDARADRRNRRRR